MSAAKCCPPQLGAAMTVSPPESPLVSTGDSQSSPFAPSGAGARASFCVYLSHMLVLLLFQKIPFSSQTLPCIVSIPLVALSAIACCTPLYLLLRRVPFARQWLI